MKILLVSQYSENLKNNKEPDDDLLKSHFNNYHKEIYQALLCLGHTVVLSDANSLNELNDLIQYVDLVFPIRSYYEYPNGDLLIRLLCQKYNKRIVGGTSFAKFYESDKIIGKLLCEKLKINTPSYILPYQIHNIKFDGPYIIKPRFGASSRNIKDDNIFYDQEKLIAFIETLPCPENYYIEKFIDGKTATIGCLKDEHNKIIYAHPYSLESKKNKVITYEDKKNKGCIKNLINNKLVINKLKKYSKMIFNMIQPCQIARFDFMLTRNNKLFFLEINETPNLSKTGGFVQQLLLTNFNNYADLISHLIKTAISSNK